MYKEELIAAVAARTTLNKREALDAIDAITNTIYDTLAQGDSVQITGFGTFELKHRSARTGRNPHTNKPVEIPARVIPSFTPGTLLNMLVKEDK